MDWTMTNPNRSSIALEKLEMQRQSHPDWFTGDPLWTVLPQLLEVIRASEEVAERVPTIARPIPDALAALGEVLP